MAATEGRLAEIIAAHRHLEGPMLPILHAVQAEFGHVPQEALPQIAEALNISRAEAHGVMSFYHDFRTSSAGTHTLKLCRAEACQAMGCDDLAARALARLGLDWHETSANGQLTLEPVFCLGLCACGPSALYDGEVIGRMDMEKIEAIATEAGL
ncbi:formate dehydrogenase subunit gamma [Frigidibacter sp. MR17.24]|uniref:formate dehydrogenase subunit gamma n=1 Tax=Frigidibacter sp. MR17.24 TaxID=3127345 RepID=UPI003012C87C